MPTAKEYGYSEYKESSTITKKGHAPAHSNAHIDSDSYASPDSKGVNRSGAGGESPGNGASGPNLKGKKMGSTKPFNYNSNPK